jgi:hypothetical protein
MLSSTTVLTAIPSSLLLPACLLLRPRAHNPTVQFGSFETCATPAQASIFQSVFLHWRLR